MTATLTFPERQGCRFSEAPNLEPIDQRVQAFEATTLSVEGPSNGVICNVTLSSAENAQIRYDDYLFLTMADNVLIGSNQEATEYLPVVNGLYQWNFDAIKGKPVTNIEAPPYCIGDLTTCDVPPHDQPGPLDIRLETSEISDLAFRLSGWRNIEVSTITTGDNDEADCSHTAITIDVSWDYFEIN